MTTQTTALTLTRDDVALLAQLLQRVLDATLTDTIDATFVVVDAHDAHDCDDSCMGCVDCHQATGATTCDRLCPHARVDDSDCDVLINLRDLDALHVVDDVDLCSDCGCDLAKGRHATECSEPDDVDAICAQRGHSFDSALNLDGGRCRRCGVRR